MKIFVDMDGVCCNWMLEALRIVHTSDDGCIDENAAQKAFTEWPIGQQNVIIKSDKFWDDLAKKGEKWWAELPELDNYNSMMAMLRRHGDVFYLTSSPYGVCGLHAVRGKLDWIYKRDGNKFRNYILTRHKYLCATPDAILIDDTPHQCEEFVKHGGTAILFPQPWNGHKPLNSHEIIAFLIAALNITTMYGHERYLRTSNVRF